jgi:hypothetical protein
VRGLTGCLLVALWLFAPLAAGTAAAQEEPGGEPAAVQAAAPRALESPPRALEPPPSQSQPRNILLRSLAFPGWGQLENGQPWKAALVMAVEGGLFASAYVELRRSDRAFEAHTKAANRGDQAEADRLFALHEDRHDRAVGRLWWLAFTVMLSALDAYVDAYLDDFEVDRSIKDQVPAETPTGARLDLDLGLDADGGTVALRMDF